MKTQTGTKETKHEGITTKMTFAGGGVGLAMFAVFGVVNASFLGGIIGINIAGALTGFPVDSSILSRAIVAIGMIMGIMIAGLMFVMAGSLAGWIIGKVFDKSKEVIAHETHDKAAHHKTKG